LAFSILITSLGHLTFGKACSRLVLIKQLRDDRQVDEWSHALPLPFRWYSRKYALEWVVGDCESLSSPTLYLYILFIVVTHLRLLDIVMESRTCWTFQRWNIRLPHSTRWRLYSCRCWHCCGATLGNALAYVHPALMRRAVVQQQGRQARRRLVLRILMGVIGVKLAI
jgi:hypothetical protein